MKFKLKQKVQITSIKKVDNSLVFGVVIGITLSHKECWLGFISLGDYVRRLNNERYKVAYECGNGVSSRIEVEEFNESELLPVRK